MKTCPCCKQNLPPPPKRLKVCDYDDAPDVRRSYQDGLGTGILWDANWMPGGPHIHTDAPKEWSGKRTENRLSKAKHNAWHKGFNEGLSILLANNKAFAKWWVSHRGKQMRGNNIEEIRWNHEEQKPGCVVTLPNPDGLPNSSYGDYLRNLRKSKRW